MLLVVKIHGTDGTVLWISDLTGTGQGGLGQSVLTNAAGDVFVGGSLNNTVSVNDFSLLKVSGATGIEQWRSELKAPLSDMIRSIAVDLDGNILAAGTTSFEGNLTFAVAKFNAITGAILWHKTVDDGGNDAAQSVAVDGVGNAFATGQLYVSSTGSFHVLTAKFRGTDGAELWRRNTKGTSPNTGANFGSMVAVDASGDAVTVGHLGNTGPNGQFTHLDFFVLKSRGSDGLELWRRELNSGFMAADSAAGVAVNADGNIFASGTLDGKFAVVQFSGIDGMITFQPTTITLQTSPSPSAAGEAVTFNVTVTSPSDAPDGMVEVFEGATLVGTATMSSGVASFSRLDLTGGTHSYIASYLGNEFFTAQTSEANFHVVTSPNVVTTGTGTGVVSAPIATLPDGTQAPVTVEFGTVTEAGATTVTASTAGPPPPDGFKLLGGQQPIYYDVETTAVFSGTARVCFTWLEGQLANEKNARLFHHVNGAWVDITASRDIQNNIICGQTTSFSPFVVAEQRIFGFYQPVDNVPVLNRTKAGSAIPIKFSLGGDEGLGIFASNSPASLKISCTAGTPLDDIEQTVSAGGSSLSYDVSTAVYTYVWKTDKAWSGTCRQLQLKLSDGSIKYATFQLVK